jgi:ADP-heptose:LPS heptosyltransferase
MAALRGLDSRPTLSVHPWASGFRSSLREWPEKRWAALGLKALRKGYDIAITGAPSDAYRANQLATLIGCSDRVSVKAGDSLEGTAETLAKSAAVVSVNTGVMHLAAALGRPTLALHGPTNPCRWGPVGAMTRVVGPGPAVGGGYLNLGFEYPTNPPDCMGMIEVEEVWLALMQLVEPAAPLHAPPRDASLPVTVETDRATA